MTTIVKSLDEFPALVGQDLGYSEWTEVDQRRIDLFAEATGDHQWIHVDPERASKGPFGSTIAHGHLTIEAERTSKPACVTQVVYRYYR